MENSTDFRLEISEYLRKHNMMSYRLAEKAGIIPTSLYRFLDGRYDITLTTYIKLKKAMK